MSPFTFSVLTFGCRVNQADSFACERDLRARGGSAVAAEAAELVVVNTCSVTAAADQAARQTIRRLARANPRGRIVATGCYATRKPQDLEGLPGVVRLVANSDKDALARLAAVDTAGRCLRSGHDNAVPPRRSVRDAAVRYPRLPQGFGLAPHPGDRGRTVYPLRVQTGCEERCSYCTIPLTRGPSRSVPVAAVLAEAEAVRDAGYQEVMLTGVHLGAYGRDLVPRRSLPDLLRALDALPGDAPTFRLSSVEPMDCGADLVSLVAASRRFAPHFHLPLQHASDRLLGAMGRPYSLRDYRALVDGIRSELPDAAIGADVIVGFPGEQHDDQALLERYLRASGLTHLHVFPYSDRPGTPASGMPGKVGAARVKERAEALRAIGAGLQRAFAQRQVGRARSGLTLEDGTRVLTDNYLKIRIPSGHRRNERVRVRITGASPLAGEVIP